MKVLDWNITELEKDVLVHGIYDYVTHEYKSPFTVAWSDNSSLSKKGLTVKGNDGWQDYVELTKDGFRVLNELVDDEQLKEYLK